MRAADEYFYNLPEYSSPYPQELSDTRSRRASGITVAGRCPVDNGIKHCPSLHTEVMGRATILYAHIELVQGTTRHTTAETCR